MNRQIKISSVEGGVFTGNNNRISFNIPEGVFEFNFVKSGIIVNIFSAFMTSICVFMCNYFK